ncbi:gustatory receptor for sugar taste 64f-like [Diprion similis]|uniref:gustatory receptor for sugar taste 64f-like n=1 Tax=Diprion similis TaxID=362088 RepID=UPI001EF8C700|nr:gustatory receptor for sugar taste 64f-like [Diprion similis]
MERRSGNVENVAWSYRAGIPPNAAWKSAKPSLVQIESVGGDFFFGRDDTTKADAVAIDVIPQNKWRDDQNRFHLAIGPILLMAQCFAVLPVSGVRSPDSSYLKFTWKSPKILYFIISLTGAITLTVSSIVRVSHSGITATKTTNIVFFGAACITMVLFLRLATRWPCLVRFWEKVENEMNISPTPSTGMQLKTRLALIAGVTITIALVEHVLSIISGYASALECAALRRDTDIVATYFQSQFPQVFDLTPYNWWKGVLVQCLNIISTFAWNFMDLFLMLVSFALASRFRQMNDHLYAIRSKAMPDWWWAQAREDYNRLANLTRRVDSNISDIVLLSFATNLYFICIQLLNSLKPRLGTPQTLYTSFSFGFLLARTAAVSLYAAAVNDESLRPSPVLYSVSTTSYSIEVQRFLSQITTDRIGLTGLNFFAITRGLILTVAGTIVTYELVLVQFNAMQNADSTIVNITDACEVK